MRKYLVALAALTLTSGVAWADHGSNQPVKDSYITTKVKAELAADHDTTARDIHVTTVDGVVTLRGARLLRRQMSDDLMAVEIEVDPFIGAAALGAAEDVAVERSREREVVHGERDMEGREETRISRQGTHGENSWWI